MTDRNCKECKHKKEKGCELWECRFEQDTDKVLRIKVLQTIGHYFGGLIQEGYDYELLAKCNRELMAQVREIENEG